MQVMEHRNGESHTGIQSLAVKKDERAKTGLTDSGSSKVDGIGVTKEKVLCSKIENSSEASISPSLLSSTCGFIGVRVFTLYLCMYEAPKQKCLLSLKKTNLMHKER